ncbi:MAG: NADPH-dependent FMN reductase [Mycobacterium sp.]
MALVRGMRFVPNSDSAGRGENSVQHDVHGIDRRKAMSTYTVGYFVGSLSTQSINRILSRALIRLAPESLSFVEISISELPLYNHDFDDDYPPPGRALKEAIAAVDAVLFVTPEYNRGIPGSLKNAIDWASRPWGTNSFAHKPSAVIGASPGKIGTAVAQQSLRSVLGFCDSPQMGAPEAYIQFTPGMITDDGEVAEQATETFLRDFMTAFDVFVTRVLTVVPREG